MRTRAARSHTVRAGRSGVAFFLLATPACAVAGALLLAPGCAAVLGFDDTTLRTDASADSSGDAAVVDAEPPPDAAASVLTVTPTSLVVRRGASAEITVNLVAGGDVTGPLTARLADLPSGVTATTAALDPPTTSGKLTVTATSAATLGPHATALFVDGTTLAAVPVPLLVADPPGALDTTFDADGLASDLSKGLGATFFALAQQTDERIIAGGAGGPVGGPLAGWIVRRFGTSGASDAAFAAAAVGLPGDGEIHGIAVHPTTGKITCVGWSNAIVAPALLTVVRLLPTGALDASFGGGTVRLPLADGAMGSSGLGVALQADGSVTVVGARRDASNVEAGVIARFTNAGARDATFNGGATVVIPLSRLVGVAVEKGGEVVAAGSTTAGALPSYVLARRNALGGADLTFGTAGTATFGNTYRANGFAQLADGSNILVGDVIPQATAAYTAGATNVKGGPLFARAFSVAPSAGFFGVAVHDDKRFIAAGHTAVANGEARVERINLDGNRDATFGSAGTVILEPGAVANGFDVTLFAAKVQADGRILVAGNRSNAGAVVYRLWP